MGNWITFIALLTAHTLWAQSVGEQLRPYIGDQTQPAKIERALASTPVESFSGDAEGIEGGDSVDGKLQLAINDVNQALSWILEKRDAKALCQPIECPAGVAVELCSTIHTLKTTQRNLCHRFITSMAEQIFKRGQKLAFTVQSKAPRVRNPAGVFREVKAATALGADGGIKVHRDAIETLSREELVALISHEIGHKVHPAQSTEYIKDNATIEGFANGRQFLDTIGAAVALYSHQFRIPLQAPPELSKTLSKQIFCTDKRTDPYIKGLGADLLNKPTNEKNLTAWNITANNPKLHSDSKERFKIASQVLASDEGKKKALDTLFEEVFRRLPNEAEEMFLKIAMNTGAPYDAIVASLLSDPEYLSRNQIHSDQQFVVHLYQDLFGRSATGPEIEAAVAEVKSLGKPAYIINLLNRSDAVIGNLVQSWYVRYLNRTPTNTETQAHNAQVQSGATWNDIQATILSSAEYSSLQNVRKSQCEGKQSSTLRQAVLTLEKK